MSYTLGHRPRVEYLHPLAESAGRPQWEHRRHGLSLDIPIFPAATWRSVLVVGHGTCVRCKKLTM